MKNFQTITIFIFSALALLGVILFAIQKSNSSDAIPQISLWGTMDISTFNKISGEIGSNKLISFKINYKQIKKDNFDSELIEALASGVGPDAIILSQDKILKYENKIFSIPFSSFSERDFRDNFIEGAEIFLTKDSIIAFPLTIDPLVMYWNRDILSNAGIVKPPAYWDEIYSIVKKITEKDNAQNLKKETIAFGEFDNIKNAKEIISALIMQSGNSITIRNIDKIQSMLDERKGTVIPATESAIRFYTEFSNPSKEMYTWNRSMDNSLKEFLAGNLAFYLGFSSELIEIREKNPNLNFDVAKLPQIRDNKINKTFANMNGISALKSSPNVNNVIKIMGYLISNDASLLFSKYFDLPPVKRELLAEKQTDAYKGIFYDSAIIGRAWLDPNPQETSIIFKDMIENVTSGRFRINESVRRASVEIQNLWERF
ncbi:MAG: extracellular solute-binding protein [Patescibacteria group bacterium]